MGLAISGIRKNDNTVLYFRDQESYDGYVNAHPEEDIEFDGLAKTNIMTDIIDMNVDRKLFENFVDSCGIDHNAVKYDDLFTPKDVDIAETEKRIAENRKKAKKVVYIDDDGKIQDSDEDPVYVGMLQAIVDAKNYMNLYMFTAKSFGDQAGYDEMMSKIEITEANIDSYFEDALNMDMSDALKLMGLEANEENDELVHQTEYYKFNDKVKKQIDIVLEYVTKKQEEKNAAEAAAANVTKTV